MHRVSEGWLKSERFVEALSLSMGMDDKSPDSNCLGCPGTPE